MSCVFRGGCSHGTGRDLKFLDPPLSFVMSFERTFDLCDSRLVFSIVTCARFANVQMAEKAILGLSCVCGRETDA